MFNKFNTILLLALIALFGGHAPTVRAETAASMPDNVPALLAKTNEAYAASDFQTFRRALEKLHKLRPNNSEYMYQLVIAHALLDEKARAYEMMLQMQRQGLSYDFSQDEQTLGIRDTQVFEYVNDLMVRAGEPMGESEALFTLPEGVHTPESLAWDEGRQKYLVGTIADGSVLAVGADGGVTQLLKASDENGMWSVYDILVDPARNRLWVSSASTPRFERYSPVDKGRAALFEFDLESLDLLHRYPVPVDGRPHILGNMTLNAAGDIFIVDRILPIVYVKAAGEQKLKPAWALRDMISMRGVALQAEGPLLYVADREMGISFIDTVEGRAGRLGVPDNLNLGGIDGLYSWGNHLVVIQNGIMPQRLMRLELDATGTRVEAVRPLAVAQPDFDFPNFGTVRGDDLVYFANSHAGGNQQEFKAVTVLRTPLESSGDLVAPDLQRFLEKARKGTFEQQEKTDGG